MAKCADAKEVLIPSGPQSATLVAIRIPASSAYCDSPDGQRQGPQRLIVAWPYSCPSPKLHGTPSKPQGGVAEVSRSVWGRPSCAVRCGEHYGRDALKVAEVKQVGVTGGEAGCRPAGGFGGDAVGHAYRAVFAVITASS